MKRESARPVPFVDSTMRWLSLSKKWDCRRCHTIGWAREVLSRSHEYSPENVQRAQRVLAIGDAKLLPEQLLIGGVRERNA
jgi:hypothetical protein